MKNIFLTHSASRSSFQMIAMNKYPLDVMKMAQTMDCGNADIPMARDVMGRMIETIPCL